MGMPNIEVTKCSSKFAMGNCILPASRRCGAHQLDGDRDDVVWLPKFSIRVWRKIKEKVSAESAIALAKAREHPVASNMNLHRRPVTCWPFFIFYLDPSSPPLLLLHLPP